ALPPPCTTAIRWPSFASSTTERAHLCSVDLSSSAAPPILTTIFTANPLPLSIRTSNSYSGQLVPPRLSANYPHTKPALNDGHLRPNKIPSRNNSYAKKTEFPVNVASQILEPIASLNRIHGIESRLRSASSRDSNAHKSSTGFLVELEADAE